MSRPTQTELLNGHKAARQSAYTKSLGDNPEGNRIEVPSNPQPLIFDEHPFSGNMNNKRVAERIAAQKAKIKSPAVITMTSPADAASQDVEKANAYEAENEGEFNDVDEGGDQNASAAPVAPTILPAACAPTGTVGTPVPPAPPAPPAPGAPASPAFQG